MSDIGKKDEKEIVENTAGDVDTSVSLNELTKKIDEANKELDQLRSGLENLSIEEKNERLDEIELAISECSQDLESLEIAGNLSVGKGKLDALRSQINVLIENKEQLKTQIKEQTDSALEELSQTVTMNNVDTMSSGAKGEGYNLDSSLCSEGHRNGGQTDLGGQSSEGQTVSQGEKKGWLISQRDLLTSREERKQNTGKNILRAAGGVGIIGGTIWLFKKIFGKKDKKEGNNRVNGTETRKERRERRRRERRERRENRPWRKSFLIGVGIAGGSVFGGVQIYKNWNKITSWIKEKLGLALNFDEAMYSVETDVRNGINKDSNFGNMCAHFEGMSYDENTQEVKSFGESVKINKNNKEIEGMGIQFASWEEMFHAINIINFAKRELKGRGANETPFTINSVTGDIDFSLSESGKTQFISANGSNFWTWVLGLGGAGGGGLLGGYFLGLKGGLTGAIAGGLAGYTVGSLIDNTSTIGRACGTIADGVNLKKFVKYLNEQNIWGKQEEQYESDNITPIHKYFNQVKREIDEGYGEEDSARRNLILEWNESNPNIYTIKSYYEEVSINLEGCSAKKGEEIDFSKIKTFSLCKYKTEESRGNGLNLDFPKNGEGLKELIRVANLTNKLRHDWKNTGETKYPFSYGRYKTPLSFEIDVCGIGTNYMGGTTILNHDTLKKYYPTLLKDLKIFPKVASIGGSSKNFQKKMHEQALNDEPKGSQYIKYLHQMGKGDFWKKI